MQLSSDKGSKQIERLKRERQKKGHPEINRLQIQEDEPINLMKMPFR